MNNITNEQLDGLIKSAVNSSGPLPPEEKFSQIISALRELRELRDAMLQGSQPVSNRDELPFDQWLSQQNGKVDVDCSCVTTEAFYHWLRVAYEAGNSPATPDGYVLVPKEITCAMDDAAWEAYHETRCMSDIWAALLSAAPQQEVKSALEHGMQRYAGAMQKLSERDK